MFKHGKAFLNSGGMVMKTLRVPLWRLVAAAMAVLSFVSYGFAADAADPQAAPPPADEKGPPLPFITIEGQGGGAFTPMAYLVNPAKECDVWGKPSVAVDYIGLGRKNLDALLLTENLFGRVEFGFSAERLGLGTLPFDINRTLGVSAAPAPGVDLPINNSDVWLYNFNVRGLLVKENADDNQWVPAITFGADLKYNADIANINSELGGALSQIGYSHDTSVDFTLTGTKTFGKAFFGRPLILTAGLRESQGANLGFLGFSDKYTPSFEGSVAILPFDKLLLAYEFRQKTSPYGTIGPGGTINVPNELIGGENNWHGFDIGYIADKHTTIVGGFGIFGNLANTNANDAWWLQLKYEF
jgi:hypothetical protein